MHFAQWVANTTQKSYLQPLAQLKFKRKVMIPQKQQKRIWEAQTVGGTAALPQPGQSILLKRDSYTHNPACQNGANKT